MLTVSDGNITLSWSRPQNIPQSVSVSYLVEINSTMRSNVTYEPVRTSGTAVVIQEDVPELEGCETFEFFVIASNDAGDSDPARIEETIPICRLTTNHNPPSPSFPLPQHTQTSQTHLLNCILCEPERGMA